LNFRYRLFATIAAAIERPIVHIFAQRATDNGFATRGEQGVRAQVCFAVTAIASIIPSATIKVSYLIFRALAAALIMGRSARRSPSYSINYPASRRWLRGAALRRE
jgi:hypothetical protein